MSSKSFPMEFEKITDVLPFTKYGLSSLKEFREEENDIQELEWLKKAGLTIEEINIFKENEAGLISHRNKIESTVMIEKLNVIYSKVKQMPSTTGNPENEEVRASSSSSSEEPIDPQKNPQTFYPDGHPMNSIKEIEQNLFGHLKNDEMLSVTKRRKILRRLERKKKRIMSLENQIKFSTAVDTRTVNRPGSLWDIKEVPTKEIQKPNPSTDKKPIIGPKKPTMYTIKDNKIVRLEPVDKKKKEFKAVDIITPVNRAEEKLLEGNKMLLDDIKKLDRFKDYEPGDPSKILYLKNIAPSVTQEQLCQLFKQFTIENSGAIDVRLMSGRMRGQAFVYFQNEAVSIKALEETNGIILSGRPIIIQFGRNTT